MFQARICAFHHIHDSRRSNILFDNTSNSAKKSTVMGDASEASACASEPPPVRAGLPSQHPTASFWQTSYPNPLTHHRSTPTLPTQPDIVVIGTGICGTFAVDEILTRASCALPKNAELDVLVLEARTLCSAATGRNGGHLQPACHSAPADILSFERSNFNDVSHMINSQQIQCDFRVLPGCLGFWNKTYFDEAKRDLIEMSILYNDLAHVVEGKDELQRLGLRGGAVGAIVQKVAASLSPYKLCVSVWKQMLERFEVSPERSEGYKGATVNLQTTTPVLSVGRAHFGSAEDAKESEAIDIWLLHTSRGVVYAKTVIVATNGYTSQLLPEFTPLIRPIQGQMSALIPPPPSSSLRLPERQLIPMSYGFEGIGQMDRVMSDYLVQNPFTTRASKTPQSSSRETDDVVGEGGHLMFGGGRHLAFNHGEGCWHDDFVDKNTEKYLRTLPERLDVSPSDADDTDASVSELPKSLDIAASWTGIMGHSADQHPWVGEVPDRGALFLAAGYSGHGMTNAPLCGRYVARLALKNLGHDCDAGADADSASWAMPERYLITKERMDRAMAGNAD